MGYQVLRYGGLVIDNVIALSTSYEFLGDRDRTAGGYLRQDLSADTPDARTWEFRTGKLTKAEADSIINLVRQNRYKAMELWIDEFGDESNTVLAYCDITRQERAPFGSGGKWHHDGCVLTLRFEEVGPR